MGEVVQLTVWSSTLSLGLDGACTVEWDAFVGKLKEANILLYDEPDILFWSGGKHAGNFKACLVYESLLAHQYLYQPEWWYYVIWKVKIP